jgi:thioredoxin 1
MRGFIFAFIFSLLLGNNGIKELNKEVFGVATRRGVVIVEYWAVWNEANKVTLLDEVEIKDAKVYRVNVDMNPDIMADQQIVVLPSIIFYDDGDEFKRLQGDMSFTLKTSKNDIQDIVDEILMSKF